MSSAAAPLEAPTVSPRQLAWIWTRHLTALYIPLSSLAFVLTAPHPWWVALMFIMPLVVAHHVDCSAKAELRQPATDTPAWPFDAMVYVLAALQIWIVIATVRLFATSQGIFSMDMAMLFVIVGSSSGFSIITAHELIHRRRKWEQNLGRLLLGTVLYEHFYTEHLRGHHVRVGTSDDPATARFGERYESFFRRTVPAQLRSAWRLETTRLGDAHMSLLDPRQLGNRVLHGLVVEWSFAFAILGLFGVPAFVAFLVQAFMAVRLLEAVNYFEHWGLQRRGERVQPVDSWDTHGWFTYYGLVGLSRHADHHAYPVRPYQKLRVWEDAPVLPYGYVGMVDLVMVNDEEFQQSATDELARRRLGPFTPDPSEEGAGASESVPTELAQQRLADAQANEAERASLAVGPGIFVRRLWSGASSLQRRVILLLGFLAVTALGVQWETGGDEMGFLARFALNGWILVAVIATFVTADKIRARWDHETFAFAVAFSLLAAVGLATGAVLG